MKKFNYYGLFLDQMEKERVLKHIFSNYYEITKRKNSDFITMYLDHCTLLHNSQCNEEIKSFCDIHKNEKFNITITNIGFSDKAVALKVDLGNVPCANKTPHITIATFEGGKPVDSNNIEYWIEIPPIVVNTKLKKV